MNKVFRLIGMLVPCALAFVAGCSKEKAGGNAQSEQAVQAPKAEKPGEKEAESRVKRDTNGTTVLTLDVATQKLMGLGVSEVKPAKLSPEVKGYGRVLDVSPLASLVADLTTAQAANDASQAELKRLKTLAGQNNASERALQAAEAAAARDQAQVAAARLKLVASWGTALAQREDLASLVQSFGALSNALVEIDVPAGASLPGSPTGARVQSISEPGKTAEAQFIGPAPAVDPQMQGRGFLFLVAPNLFGLSPGAAVTGFLSLPGEEQNGALIPRNAIVRYSGGTWVYRQTGEETFERIEVPLEHPLADGWFARQPVKPGDKLVTSGAQELLSEELKGAGGD